MLRIAGRKPMSSIRSTSSSTSISTEFRFTWRRRRKSSSRPGVATTSRGPRPSWSNCTFSLRAPAHQHGVGLRLRRNLAVRLEHLHRQLARRQQDQRADRPALALARRYRVRIHALNHRDQKGKRFAGAGRSGRQNIVALKRRRNRLRLHRRRRIEACGRKPRFQRVRHVAKSAKCTSFNIGRPVFGSISANYSTRCGSECRKKTRKSLRRYVACRSRSMSVVQALQKSRSILWVCCG